MIIHLMWFRNDLRIHDNTALYAACKNKDANVLSVFISTPYQWKKHLMSFKKSEYIYKNLLMLQENIIQLGIPLYYYESRDFFTSVEYLIHFCRKHRVNAIFYNRQYEINERKRDCLIQKILEKENISVHAFHDEILVIPDKIHKKNGQAYNIFSFFKKNIIKILQKKIPQTFPIPNVRSFLSIKKNIIKFTYPRENIDEDLFPIGECCALSRLFFFIDKKIKKYDLEHHFPNLNSTSCLSVCLSVGVLSSRQCINLLFKKQLYQLNNNIDKCMWLNELIWREFYKHLLIRYPKISQFKSLSNLESKIIWNTNKKHFTAWKEGKTGYPIVDAGMRQLNTLGWMHNRIRMITASFLVKDLLINWREGEQYFISKLIDGDLAINNGNWQWVASIGANSMPYFRIFNPTYQAKKFDKTGFFIKTYLPELRIVPNTYIFTPHFWAQKTGNKIDYPLPIVDHHKTKKNVTSVFESAKLLLLKARYAINE
ncbi:MAG TPA: deoxyribodipyrimidine photo-lyase [Buchnera sp. (in: enterobacteria)]|nr:deoxyribodipyrimidine photo-lyase [Buchnera sp. (in: enterobacteria)]